MVQHTEFISCPNSSSLIRYLFWCNTLKHNNENIQPQFYCIGKVAAVSFLGLNRGPPMANSIRNYERYILHRDTSSVYSLFLYIFLLIPFCTKVIYNNTAQAGIQMVVEWWLKFICQVVNDSNIWFWYL